MGGMNLPQQRPGYTLDSMLTPKQFCLWARESLRWWYANWAALPGVIRESRKHVRIHPRTYLDRRLGRGRPAAAEGGPP